MAVLCMAAAGVRLPAKAAGSARISFSDISCRVGETFTVNMSVNASGATLAAMDAVLLYPTDYLELVSCSVPSPGSYNSPGGGTIIMNRRTALQRKNARFPLHVPNLRLYLQCITTITHR